MNELNIIIFCSTGILILVGFIVYRIRRMPDIIMVLDKGGIFDVDGKYIPDMLRHDLKEFSIECAKNGIPPNFAEEFLLQLFNMSTYLNEPPAPKIEDELYKVWGIDDDIENLINPKGGSQLAPPEI